MTVCCPVTLPTTSPLRNINKQKSVSDTRLSPDTVENEGKDNNVIASSPSYPRVCYTPCSSRLLGKRQWTSQQNVLLDKRAKNKSWNPNPTFCQNVKTSFLFVISTITMFENLIKSWKQRETASNLCQEKTKQKTVTILKIKICLSFWMIKDQSQLI